jgi:catalase (peroxidase I)
MSLPDLKPLDFLMAVKISGIPTKIFIGDRKRKHSILTGTADKNDPSSLESPLAANHMALIYVNPEGV